MEVWSDFICPWCYIGKRRFEAALGRFEHAGEVEVLWRSFELDPGAPRRRTGAMADHVAAKYGLSVEEAKDRLNSLNRLAAHDGLHYDLARTRGGNTFDAHRLAHLARSKDPKTAAQLEEALFNAYFCELQPIGDHDVLVGMGVCAGLDTGEVKDLLASDAFADAVREEEAVGATLGCTGVPFYVIDRRFALPGAQDVETFEAVLRRAWHRSLVDGPAR